MEKEKTACLPKLAAKFGSLSRPDGSALLAHGETVVQAGIYGPVEVRLAREISEKATVEVFYRAKVGQQSCSDRLSEKIIRSTLETVMMVALHPRTSISISLQELHNDGGLLACCVNAACLAAMDAGLAMKCQVAAISAILTRDGALVLHPRRSQEQEAQASFVFSFESSQEHKVVSTHTTGSFSDEEFSRCMKLCQGAANQVFNFYRETLQRRYIRFLPTCQDEDD